MGRSLSPIVKRELASLDKDSESQRSAMRTLKSYAKGLDSKAIPQFLAQVSETKVPGAFSGECTISLYELLARVHGRNIVPQIDNIMTTIIRTLSLSVGSFKIHQACSKVVPAIARYGIDPSTPDTEKTRIIGSLCKPLSDVLMSTQESLASGSALCLKGLIESNNWKFASADMVNEVCLKVTGALEENTTQTNSHMGVVMALAKHNVLTIEAYARSLIRSGLQILNAGISENSSQKRFSAVQMINFLMKCVDSRSIFSEMTNVVNIMDKCQADHMPYIQGAAFEALQTAKFITLQRGNKHDISPGHIKGFNFGSSINKTPGAERDSVADFASPESRTVDSCITYDVHTDSPPSTAQSSCNVDCNKRTSRRLWNNDLSVVNISLKDGLFNKAGSDHEDSDFNGDLSDTDEVHLESFTGFVHAKPTSPSAQDKTPSPQRSPMQLTLDDINIFTSPRKLVRSLQSTTDNSHPAPGEDVEINKSHPLCELNWYSANADDERMKDKKQSQDEDGSVVDDTESVSSSNDLPECSAEIVNGECEFTNQVQNQIVSSCNYGKAVLSFVWCLLTVFLAMVILELKMENAEEYFDVVPT